MPSLLSIATIFANHMVLQRNKTMSFWGKAQPDSIVEINLVKNQACLLCNRGPANHDGNWLLTLPAQPAGGPFQLRISQSETVIIIDDVLIGDVWLASGQSNMEWKLAWQVDDWQREVAVSDNANIRFFELAKTCKATPQIAIPKAAWKIASPTTSHEFSAVAWHFAKRYQQHCGIPLAIIDSTWGGTPAEAWTSIKALQHILAYQDEATILLQNSQLSSGTEANIPNIQLSKWQCGVLFNAMIHPLTQFPICGVLWYQGENNVTASEYYAELFKGLITDWRKHWQQPNMPFLFVQLASYHKQREQPIDSDWALLREAQTHALTLANTGMAVTIDIGDANDIHPRNKADVGERLWRIAQNLVLNENVSYAGPTMKHIESQVINGKNVLVVTYTHLEGGLHCKGKELLGFALAGTDGKFFNAQAIIQDDQVIVSSNKVKQPLSLRYAWADNSPANLYNAANFPAVPFRGETSSGEASSRGKANSDASL